MGRDNCYIALCKCGKMVMCCVDDPRHRKGTAKEVADCVAKGYEIKLVSIDYVRDAENEFCGNQGRCKAYQEKGKR